MGVLVGESPAGPNTPCFLGVKDLEAGSLGNFVPPRTGVISGLPLLCAVHVELEIIPPLATGSDRFPSIKRKTKNKSRDSEQLPVAFTRQPCYVTLSDNLRVMYRVGGFYQDPASLAFRPENKDPPRACRLEHADDSGCPG